MSRASKMAQDLQESSWRDKQLYTYANITPNGACRIYTGHEGNVISPDDALKLANWLMDMFCDCALPHVLSHQPHDGTVKVLSTEPPVCGCKCRCCYEGNH